MKQQQPSVPDFADIPELSAAEPPALSSLAAQRAGAHATRARIVRGRRIAVLASVVWIVVQFAAFGLRPDLSRLPVAYIALFSVAPALVGALLALLALRPGKFGLGPQKWLLIALSLAAPAVFLVTSVLMPPPHAGGIEGGVSDAAYCLNSALAWMLLPLVCAALALRGAFPTRARWRSGTLAAGVGLVAVGLYNLHCPIIGHWHLALSHGGAVVLATLSGALLLSRSLRL